MTEENNTTDNGSNSANTNKETSSTGSNTGGSATGSSRGSAAPDDNYYAVDYVKKDVVSTIGDGEMHDEGLVGEGDTAAISPASQDPLSDEQDGAEMHDNRG